jgi:hypothetical protein
MRIWDQTTQGQIPEIVRPLIGQAVVWAGVLPSSKTLVLRFQKQLLMIEPNTSVGQEALTFELGDIVPGADFSDLDSESRTQNAHTRELVGMQFTGVDGAVLIFNHAYGVRVNQQQGVAFLKRRQ